MKNRIDRATEQKLIPKEIKEKHKGFSEWNSGFTKNNHQSVVQVPIIIPTPHDQEFFASGFLNFNQSASIFSFCFSSVQIIISEKTHNFCVDIDGHQLPTLVYLSREKRPQRSHNFKAGSMNALVKTLSFDRNNVVIVAPIGITSLIIYISN